MKLFYNIDYSLTKNDPIKEVFQRIKNILDRTGLEVSPYFYFSDQGFPGGVSAIQRVLKKFPELAKFEHKVNSERVLSNFPQDFSYYQITATKGIVQEAISFDVLQQIAEGIPRSYPFNEAIFLFDKMNWSNDSSDDFDLNSILYMNNWSIPKRDMTLVAKVEVPLPANDEREVEPIKDSVKESLAILGHIKKETLKFTYNQKEKSALEELQEQSQEMIYSRYHIRKNPALLNELQFPYDLTAKRNHPGVHNIPRKPTVSKVIKKYGYKPLPKEGFPGVIVYGKLTEHNNRILLEFDSGSTFYNLRCNFIIQGPHWDHRIFELPCRKDSYGDFFPISDEETLEQVVENLSVVIRYLEDTFVKDLEESYGSSPLWYRY